MMTFKYFRAPLDTEEARATQQDQRHRSGAGHLPVTSVEVLALLRSAPRPRTARQIIGLTRRCLPAIRRALELLLHRGLARRVGRARASKGGATSNLWEAVPE